jgi:hypothetical protein
LELHGEADMTETAHKQTFFRNFFGLFCIVFLVTGFLFSSLHAFWLSLFCGVFSRTAERKWWPDPPYGEALKKKAKRMFGLLE